MAVATDDLLAFSDTRAMKIAGISRRRLRSWEEQGLVASSVKRQLGSRTTVRLYSYQDVLALLVVSALRVDRGMSLRHIRRVAGHLRSRGYAAPLRELKFAAVGREIYFQLPDGSWEGDLRPDHLVLVETIRLDRLRSRIDKAAERPAADAGQVVRHRGVHASAPVFAGTRIRVSTVQEYLRHGFDADAILRAFPDLGTADIDEARRLLAVAG